MSYTQQPQHVLEAMSYLLEQELTTHRFLSMELCLMKEYWTRNQNGYLVLTRKELAEVTDSSARTIRSFHAALIESGRWEIHVGSGYAKTIYKPLFLAQIKQAERKGN